MEVLNLGRGVEVCCCESRMRGDGLRRASCPQHRRTWHRDFRREDPARDHAGVSVLFLPWLHRPTPRLSTLRESPPESRLPPRVNASRRAEPYVMLRVCQVSDAHAVCIVSIPTEVVVLGSAPDLHPLGSLFQLLLQLRHAARSV